MISYACNICIYLVVIWLHGFVLQEVHSFSSVAAKINFLQYPSECQEAAPVIPISFRIRSTKECDVHRGISDMCVDAMIDSNGERGNPTTRGFRRQIYLLKSKKSVTDLLLARLNAIRTAETTMEECDINYEDEKLSEADKLRYLWSNDRFRNTFEKAAKLANEPHRWNSHNFACAPKTIECLQHKMLTAEDTKTGEVVGFCEVAMLLDPSSFNGSCGSSEEQHILVRPTMVNLVVSPKHRRRGVASRIIKSAMKYVKREWDACDLNLYVDDDNNAAIELYSSQGFHMTSSIQLPEHRCRQLYMTMPFSSLAKQKSQNEAFQLSS